MADLFATVLRPIAEQRGLETWEQLAAYAAEEWYPSRIAFGKHKGRSIAERCPAGSRGFQAPDDTRYGIVAERRLRRMRRDVIEGRRRSATRVTCGNEPGLESPGYRRSIAPRWPGDVCQHPGGLLSTAHG